MIRVHVRDLIGRPYKRGAFDCSTVARLILQRADIVPFRDDDEGALLGWITGEASPWRFLGADVDAASRVGDVVLCDSKDAPCGVWTLQDASRPRVFATALPSRGFTLAKARAITGVRGVYRMEAARALTSADGRDLVSEGHSRPVAGRLASVGVSLTVADKSARKFGEAA